MAHGVAFLAPPKLRTNTLTSPGPRTGMPRAPKDTMFKFTSKRTVSHIQARSQRRNKVFFAASPLPSCPMQIMWALTPSGLLGRGRAKVLSLCAVSFAAIEFGGNAGVRGARWKRLLDATKTLPRQDLQTQRRSDF